MSPLDHHWTATWKTSLPVVMAMVTVNTRIRTPTPTPTLTRTPTEAAVVVVAVEQRVSREFCASVTLLTYDRQQMLTVLCVH